MGIQYSLYRQALQVSTPEGEAALAEEHAEELAAAGFTVDRAGPGTLAVREVPVALAGQDVAGLLADALADLGAGGTAHRIDGSQNATSVVGPSVIRVLLDYAISTTPELKDKRVRQALRFATDTEAVLQAAHRGLGKPGEHSDWIEFDQIRFVGYAFQIEMKFTAWKLGFKVVEVPITFTDREQGQSKMSKGIIKEGVLGVLKMQYQTLFQHFTKKIRRRTR